MQDTEQFSFDVCRSCKYITIKRGYGHFSVKCKKNSKGEEKTAFVSAFLTDHIGYSAEVEIINQ